MYKNYKKGAGPGRKTKARPDYSRKNKKNDMGFSFLSSIVDSFEGTMNDIFIHEKPKKKKTARERDEELRKKKEENRQKRENKEKKPEDEKPPTPKPPTPKPEPPKPKPKVITEEELAKRLHVKGIDFHIEENTQRHHTDKYECVEKRKNDDDEDADPELVVRRGDKFKMTITFDRPYEKKDNDLKLIFFTGDKPAGNRGTEAFVDLDETRKEPIGPYEWGASLLKQSGNDITISVYIPANCVIGEWELKIRTFDTGKTKEGKDKTLICDYIHDEDFYILFNPWCKDDQVYFGTTNLLDEYILNPNGCIFSGNQYCIGCKPWNFGQFEEGVLDAALYIVRKAFGFKVDSYMADPVRVARAISQMVNNCDDDGILVGNWSGDYEGGTSPTKWVGSVKIIREYMKTGEPVCFGQCWVFSGITTTVCRALGIPAFSVTNFASAHDTDGSCTIDKYFDCDGNPLEYNADSVWNFHVWNELWMERPDLGSGYGGWQVIDATPQETSDGFYVCGPASLEAIKRGECDKPNDTGFVFAEVNGDRVEWRDDPTCGYVPQKIRTDSVGKCISTKKPDGEPYEAGFFGSAEKSRQDVTNTYKFKEGSTEERAAALRANQTATNARDLYNIKTKQQDVKFSLLHANDVMVGDCLDIKLHAKDVGNTSRTIDKAVIRLFTCDYTGVKTDEKPFKEETFPGKELAKDEECEFAFTLKPEDYAKHLIEQANIKIEAMSTVKAKGHSNPAEVTFKSHDFRFRRPDLVVKPKKTQLKIGEPVEVEVTFKNPYDMPLNGAELSFESGGCRRVEDIKIGSIKPKAEIKETIKAVPKLKGKHQLQFSLDTKEIPDVTGTGTITVEKK